LNVHPGMILVNNQPDAHFFLYAYFYSRHISGSHVPIIRRIIVSMRYLVYVTLCNDRLVCRSICSCISGNNNVGRIGRGLLYFDVADICWTDWKLSLELNLVTILSKNQLDAHLFCIFISILHIFRAAMCPSSGESLYQCDIWFMSLCVMTVLCAGAYAPAYQATTTLEELDVAYCNSMSQTFVGRTENSV